MRRISILVHCRYRERERESVGSTSLAFELWWLATVLCVVILCMVFFHLTARKIFLRWRTVSYIWAALSNQLSHCKITNQNCTCSEVIAIIVLLRKTLGLTMETFNWASREDQRVCFRFEFQSIINWIMLFHWWRFTETVVKLLANSNSFLFWLNNFLFSINLAGSIS